MPSRSPRLDDERARRWRERRRARWRPAGSVASCRPSSRRDGGRHQVGRADEQRVRRFVVLGLRQEIGGDEARVGRVVGDDEDLARAGDAVDRDGAEDEALRARDVVVAGPDDLVDADDALRAVGERRDRLGAARVHDGRDARQMRRRVDRVVRLVAGERRGEQDLRHARDPRRDGRHQDAGGVARPCRPARTPPRDAPAGRARRASPPRRPRSESPRRAPRSWKARTRAAASSSAARASAGRRASAAGAWVVAQDELGRPARPKRSLYDCNRRRRPSGSPSRPRGSREPRARPARSRPRLAIRAARALRRTPACPPRRSRAWRDGCSTRSLGCRCGASAWRRGSPACRRLPSPLARRSPAVAASACADARSLHGRRLRGRMPARRREGWLRPVRLQGDDAPRASSAPASRPPSPTPTAARARASSTAHARSGRARRRTRSTSRRASASRCGRSATSRPPTALRFSPARRSSARTERRLSSTGGTSRASRATWPAHRAGRRGARKGPNATSHPRAASRLPSPSTSESLACVPVVTSRREPASDARSWMSARGCGARPRPRRRRTGTRRALPAPLARPSSRVSASAPGDQRRCDAHNPRRPRASPTTTSARASARPSYVVSKPASGERPTDAARGRRPRSTKAVDRPGRAALRAPGGDGRRRAWSRSRCACASRLCVRALALLAPAPKHHATPPRAEAMGFSSVSRPTIAGPSARRRQEQRGG